MKTIEARSETVVWRDSVLVEGTEVEGISQVKSPQYEPKTRENHQSSTHGGDREPRGLLFDRKIVSDCEADEKGDELPERRRG
jgi:hypothetical protein